ncbi:LytTR family DNA-binding domain-containing protein [Gymnodinialimonas sp. 2305UL16-5]|uniref:LytTR family DNA-binding domain-containing protein n=1 Tax=Gymnodinialimonas mytili TaxID=3126503 RepID=UPI0030B2892E
MNDATLPSALREMRAHFSNRRVIFALLGIGVILGLLGPFGTDRSLTWGVRMGYWISVPVLTYGLGYLCHALVLPSLAGLPRLGARGIAGLVTGMVIAPVIVTINRLAFGASPDWSDVALILGIAIMVTLLMMLLPDSASSAQEAPPAILDRLPIDKRGALVALSVEDHYVRVRTTQGEEMVLMRLGDAIRETEGAKGLKVHRSHWVALDQVTKARRRGDGALLSVTHGDDIPVSRAHMPAIRDAGLLPR